MSGITKISVILMFFLVFIMPLLAQDANNGIKKGDDVVIGKSITMESNILKMAVNLKISVPGEYEKSGHKYPVLYIFRDYFHTATGLIQSLLSYNAVPALIVVDVTNCPSDAFTPTKIAGWPNTGGADNLIQFMKDELIPFVDSHYRTRPYRIIFSSSWGGLFCTYALLTAPDVFNAAIACGPWLIYDNLDLITLKNKKAFLKKGTYQDNFFMLKNAGTFLKKNTYSHNFLFFTGGDQPELVPSLQVFVQILKDHAPEELEWVYEPMPRQDHGSLIPFTIYEGLKKLYSDWREVPESVIMEGKRELKIYRDRLAKKFGYDIGISEISIRSYGWEYMKEKRFTKAIALFKFNTEINLDSADAYYSLGRAYEAAGQLGLAKENYEIACKMADNLPPSMLEMYKNSLERVIKKIKE